MLVWKYIGEVLSEVRNWVLFVISHCVTSTVTTALERMQVKDRGQGGDRPGGAEQLPEV